MSGRGASNIIGMRLGSDVIAPFWAGMPGRAGPPKFTNSRTLAGLISCKSLTTLN